MGNLDEEKILKTEYSNRFDEIRKNMMIQSYFKYGAMRDNYKKFKCMIIFCSQCLEMAGFLENILYRKSGKG